MKKLAAVFFALLIVGCAALAPAPPPGVKPASNLTLGPRDDETALIIMERIETAGCHATQFLDTQVIRLEVATWTMHDIKDMRVMRLECDSGGGVLLLLQ